MTVLNVEVFWTLLYICVILGVCRSLLHGDQKNFCSHTWVALYDKQQHTTPSQYTAKTGHGNL